jgi:hypothetical protein
MLRNGAERDVAERAMDLPRRAFVTPDQAQDFAATRRCERGQCGGHAISLD